jgi:hypothetical protein
MRVVEKSREGCKTGEVVYKLKYSSKPKERSIIEKKRAESQIVQQLKVVITVLRFSVSPRS